MVTIESGSMRIDSTAATADEARGALDALDTSSAAPAAPLVHETADSGAPEAATAQNPAEKRESADVHKPAPVDPDDDAHPLYERNEDGTFKAKAKRGSVDELRQKNKAATWARRETERQLEQERAERARLAAELEALRRNPPAAGAGESSASATPAPAAPIVDPNDPEPREEDFEAYRDFVKAQAQWAIRDAFRQREAQEAHTRALSEAQRAKATWEQRFASAQQTLPDLPQAIEAMKDRELSPAIARAVIEADRGPEMLHYLATHPEECAQLVEDSRSLPPSAAPVMRRLLEAKLSGAPAASSGPAAATTRKAVPAPIQPVGASPVVAELSLEDIAKLPLPEYTRVMNARDQARWKAKHGG
jgi:hypothetical protein